MSMKLPGRVCPECGGGGISAQQIKVPDRYLPRPKKEEIWRTSVSACPACKGTGHIHEDGGS